MAWVSPTGYDDPSDEWDDEELAYDGNTATNAEGSVDPHAWGGFLELTHAAFNCDKVRYYADYDDSDINEIDVDVYYDGDWHDVYEGEFADKEYEERAIPAGTKSVTAARVRFFNDSGSGSEAAFYEFGFNEIEGVDVTVEVPLATVASQAYTPTPSLGMTISPPTATIASQAHAPTLALDKILAIPLATVLAQAYAPEITEGQGVIIAIPVAAVLCMAPVPVVGVGVAIDIPLATVESQAYTPRILNMRVQAAVRNLEVIRVLPSVREDNPV